METEHALRTISSRAVTRIDRPVDERAALATLERVASEPTVPFHEWRALAAIRAELERLGLAVRTDTHGQVFAHLSRGRAKRALVFVAHTDHPGFEIVEATGSRGIARVRGGLRPETLRGAVPAVVYRDGLRDGHAATVSGYVEGLEVPNWSSGYCEIAAERPLRVGDWAVLDLPAFERRGQELHLRAADDLAGCALILSVLAHLADEQRAFDVHAVFTRAEEPGLFGARLVAAERSIPADAYVVSVEASNATFAPAGAGIVVRAGDYHNTFSNEAERYLRVARERLAERGIRTQRALLQGGTCEASAFVRLGWVATGIALPNTGYHNAGPDGRFVPEMIRLDDLLSGIALSAEACVAAGADAAESWWPDAQAVPGEIKRLLGESPTET